MYRDQKIALATMHNKAVAIAPAFKKLGAVIVVPEIDTDVLGTFSGEKLRTASQRETVIKKARMGMHSTGLAYGLASEGSFGPHPLFPFGYVGYELLAFIDDIRGFMLIEEEIFYNTNFNSLCVTREADISDFLKATQFPSHGLLVRPEGAVDNAILFKGIKDYHQLQIAITQSCLNSTSKRAIIETDMRAHMNPTRMKAIKTLAQKLAHRLTQLCPTCKSPGFGVIKKIFGLACAWCASPTELLSEVVYGCVACSYCSVEKAAAQPFADPYNCARCNP